MSSARVAVYGLALAVSVAVAGCGGSSTSTAAASPASSAPPPAQTPAPRPEPAPPAPASSSARKEWTRPPAISDADLPPMPVVPFAAARPMEIVRAVYVFAGKHPEVLSKVPCFCGCETRGHRSNDDCFVARRDPQGRPIAWEPHGVGCAICLDVAHESMQMHASGTSIADIRAAIEQKYRGSFPTMTPTPPVPRGR